MINSHPRIRNKVITVFVLSGIFMAVFVFLYYMTLPSQTKAMLLGLFDIAAATSTAIAASLVCSSYGASDSPRKVWLYFSIGFWCWVAAEAVYYLSILGLKPFPYILVARMLWFIAYIPFTLALNIQYHLVNPKTSISRAAPYIIWVTLCGAAYLLANLAPSDGLTEDFFAYFIAIANIIVGIVALKLVLTFRGGLMARPWWGFLCFVLADVLYIFFLFLGGEEMQSLANLATHIIYLVAYLILAAGFYLQYLLLKFGADPWQPDGIGS